MLIPYYVFHIKRFGAETIQLLSVRINSERAQSYCVLHGFTDCDYDLEKYCLIQIVYVIHL